MAIPRRDVLAAGAGAWLLGLARHAAAGPMPASPGVGSAGPDSDADTKALVCVFLEGGNDGNNTVVPLDDERHALYAQARGALALPREALVPLPDADGVARHGLHPALQPLAGAWAARRLALLLNTGALTAPLDRAGYLQGGARPDNLFSHADQQDTAQALLADGVAPVDASAASTGWGYRLGATTHRDAASAAATRSLPSLISFAGNHRFLQGDARASLVLPARGAFGDGAAPGARRDTWRALWNAAGAGQGGSVTSLSPMAAETGRIVGGAWSAAELVNPILAAPPPLPVDPLGGFAALDSDVSRQLLRVARLLQAGDAIGRRRRIYFVAMGGYDTHVDQLGQHARLLGDLGAALQAFDSGMQALGLGRQVTLFTLSEFSRTLRPNSGGGSDHGWGSHQLVLGGAVRGGAAYGRLPELALGSADDAGGEGRWIPTTSNDQVAATLARWFGVGPAELAAVVPRIGRYDRSDLGWMA